MIRTLTVLLALLALGAASPADASRPHGHRHPHIAVCQTRAQTGCLWIDGHAEWHR